MKEHIIPSNSFIAGWYIEDNVCDGLISYFNDSPDQGPGQVGQGINEEYKVSTDVAVIPRVKDERIQIYLDRLGKVCDNLNCVITVLLLLSFLESWACWSFQNVDHVS